MLGDLLAGLSAFKRGDFSARLPETWTGIAGKVADTFNDVIRRNQERAGELATDPAARAAIERLLRIDELLSPASPRSSTRCGDSRSA